MNYEAREKPTIKVKFCDWGATRLTVEHNPVRSVLEKHYILDETGYPDFVFYNIFGVENFKYRDSIKVLYATETNFPNFDNCDYAATWYPDLKYDDRVFSDIYVFNADSARKFHDLALEKHLNAEETLRQKSKFCCFVQSFSGPTTKFREELFDQLSKYKIVDSGGRYKNNIGRILGGRNGGENEFYQFGLPYKFSITCGNEQNYILEERPTNGFAIKSVPIYWGNPQIGRYFNEGAFINCHRYQSVEEVLERVIELDKDDEQYLKMLQTPAFIRPETSAAVVERFEQWLINIIEHGTRQRSGGFANMEEEKKYELGSKLWYQRAKVSHALGVAFAPVKHSKVGLKVRKMLVGH